MAQEETQAIYVKHNEDPMQEGLLYYCRFNTTDRLFRALKVLLLFWLAALIAVFIPIAHFILVPSLLLVGPVMAFYSYRLEKAAKNAQVHCPNCMQQVSISMEPKSRPPIYTYCPACDSGLQLVSK